MLKENKRTEESFKKTVTENKDKILDSTAKKYDQTVMRGKKLGQDALTNIEKTTKTGSEFIKSQQYGESLKDISLKIREKGTEHEKNLKKHGPKFYRKIANGFFNFFETMIGRIKIGTQYGNSSLELLEKLARLRELGIITEEEFTKKKKKILDRI